MNPLSLAAFTGMPSGKKKASRGARTRSGKPGAEHIGALQRAHAKGDFKAAKRAALDYANVAHKHLASESPEEHAALVAAESETPTKAAPKMDRAALAKIAANRKK